MDCVLYFKLFFILTCGLYVGCHGVEDSCVRLQHGKKSFHLSYDNIQCFKYIGVAPKITSIFSSTFINITSANQTPFKLFTGNSSGKEKMKPLWLKGIDSIFTQHSSTSVQLKVSPFKRYEFSLSTSDSIDSVIITIQQSGVDSINVGLFIAGIILMNAANPLSRSTIFHYTSGVSFGIVTSFLVILFLLYKLLPYKKVIAAGLATGLSITLYLIEYVWTALIELLLKYPYYVAVFCVSTGLMSAALIYFYGPPKHERTFNLIQWALQGVSVYMIYQSSYYVDFTITVIVFIIAFQFFTIKKFAIKIMIYMLPRKMFMWLHPPPKKRFLTLEEYDLQGEIETKKALKELAAYCDSPKCNAWSLVGKLKTPQKFATFLNNGDHLTQEELDAYDEAEFSDSFQIVDDEMPSFERPSTSSSPHSNSRLNSTSNKEWLSDDDFSTLLTD